MVSIPHTLDHAHAEGAGMTRLRLLAVEEEEDGEEYLVNNMEVEVAATDTFYWCSVHRSGRHFSHVKAEIKLSPWSIAIFLTNPLLRLGQQFAEKLHVLRCQHQIILDDSFKY